MNIYKAAETKIVTFESTTDLRQWLYLNHATETELWIKVFKKSSGVKSVTWNDIVLEVLCWGWIDGSRRSFDAQAFLQRITPRTARSIWSKKNTEHAERLIRDGKMQAPGLIQINEAKIDGRWEKAYVASELEVPEDFLVELENHPSAEKFFKTLNKSSRHVIAHGLTSAKKAETRCRRFNNFICMLNREQKPK